MIDPTVQRQLDAVLSAVERVLGPAVVGAWLHGSAGSGGLRPRSDLDVLVASARGTTEAEKRRLVDELIEISDRDDRPGYERPVELSIVVPADLRPWRYPPPLDFQYGEWRREHYARGEVGPEHALDPDLAIVLTSVLGANEQLRGPGASEVFDPVPRTDLRRALTDELPMLLPDLFTDTRNIVLTLARVWLTLVTGEIRSKDAAADWVLERLPDEHRPVVARARAIYLGDEAERWDDLRDRLEPFADRIVGEIRHA
jgi:streptomycin 3"-adenylyltransferase